MNSEYSNKRMLNQEVGSKRFTTWWTDLMALKLPREGSRAKRVIPYPKGHLSSAGYHEWDHEIIPLHKNRRILKVWLTDMPEFNLRIIWNY